TAPASAGTYEIRYLLNNGYTSAATSNTFSIAATPTYAVSVTKTNYAPGESIAVNWSAPSGHSSTDWISLYSSAATNTQYGAWYYTGSNLSGTLSFTAPASAGTYEIRYLMNNGYTSAATSNRFSTVTSADTTPPTVSITSPTAGNSYSFTQTVSIVASAFDNVGVTKVEFYDGGVLKGTATTAPYSYPWSIAQADDGTHTWTAKAYDAAGNTATS